VTAAASCGPTGPIPAHAGIGLRGPHVRDLIERQPALGWLEVHSENYFGAGGAPLRYLEHIRADYPLSLHGVGLSLGSADPLNRAHLERLRALCERFQPGLVSEHLSWGSIDGLYLNDLLPLPYTEEALDHFCLRVTQTQEFLGQQILIENPSSYLRYRHSTIPEHEFLVAVARRSGCGILLDVNNVYVSACNHGFDAEDYLQALPRALVEEVHLAGHAVKRHQRRDILIDDHGSRVREPVWGLFRQAIRRFGRVPALIEWDTDIPPLEILLDEAARAEAILAQEQHHALVA
jgi:uncharacterized protein (UPF0276 family)